MRITHVETFPISVPLAHPVQMAHVTIARSHNVLVRIGTDSGAAGWGEGVEAMDVTGENQGRIEAGIRHLGERLVGRDPRQRTRIWRELSGAVHGNRTAIGALDIALHDLAGHAHGLPVCDLIGGAIRTEVPALTLLGSGDPEADLETFRARYAAGFRWFKIKLGLSSREAETVALLTDQGDDVVVGGDANGVWDEHRALRFLRSVDGTGIEFVEQPTLDTGALLRVAARSPVAICADESARSLGDIAGFGPTAVAGVSLKLIKLGGITGVMRGAALCDALGLSINLAGKVAESSVAAAANVHCAAAIDSLAYGCSPANQNLAADVTATPLTVVDGAFPVPGGPGLGVEVDMDLVRDLSS